MRRWRKSTWAIAIWTIVMALWIGSGVGATAGSAAQSSAYAAGATIGVTILFVLWLLVLVPLALIWFASRPKDNVTIYGPAGQQVIVSEREARKRVESQGWNYQR